MNDVTLKDGRVLSIQTLEEKDLHILLALQDEVVAALAEGTFLQPLSTEEFQHILKGNGMMIGAFYEGRCIAFRAMLIPAVDEVEHLADDAHIPESEWEKVIYSEISNVHPDFRGNSLQKILGKVLFELVDPSVYRYVLATVAPFNMASLLDKFAQGMHIVALKEKYGGLLRYVLVRDFTEVVPAGEATVVVDMADTKEQQRLLEEGWKGIRVRFEDEKWFVVYAK